MNPVSAALYALMKALIGAHPRWHGEPPSWEQCIYFANHTSHLDTLAIWAALPAALRPKTHPIAAKDYWGQGPIRRYVALKGLNAVLIDRQREGRVGDPLAPVIETLEKGDSIILFPEGTRGPGPLPSAFRSGLYRLAQLFPLVRLVPVYLENLHRAMPKGTLMPVPLICAVRFGAAIPNIAGESKEAFLERARAAVVALA
jgi:1-acyl-sn-glycerol-3-phosphate acyltransferase